VPGTGVRLAGQRSGVLKGRPAPPAPVICTRAALGPYAKHKKRQPAGVPTAAILGLSGRGYAELPRNGTYANFRESPECELRQNGVVGSSANIQNQGVRKGPSQVETFLPSYASACISEHVWEHSTTTKKIG
jgi:hypothetical protein